MKPSASLILTITAIPVFLFAAAVPGALADTPQKPSKKEEGKIQAQSQEQPVDLSQPLTLDKAIRIGLQRQYTLGIAQSQVQSARAGVTRANAAYLPTISPTYNYSTQKTTQVFNGQRQTGTVENSTTQIGANLLIFDMFKREHNAALSRNNARAAEYNFYDTRQDIIQDVSTAYYELKRRKELVRVADASVERAQTTLDVVNAEVEAGKSARKDIYQAEADLKNAQVQQIQANNDVRIAQTQLKSAMGVLSAFPVMVEEEPLPIPSLTPDPRTAAEYVQTAFNNRQDLKRESELIGANKQSVKIADINAGFQVEASINEGYRIDPVPGESRSFGTSFSYPLFDAGAARAAVRQAKASLEQAKLQQDLTRQNIQLAVEQSYFNREEARASISATQAAVLAARTNYEAAQEAKREGAVSGTLLDIITAQAQLVTAETNAVQAIYNFYTSDAQLKRAIGTNDTFPGGK